MNIDQKYIKIIQEDHADNKSKDEIANKIFEMGLNLSQINLAFKESGVKFRRNSEDSWKMRCARLFRENPTATRDEMLDAIGDSVNDPLYYVKGYYEMFVMTVNPES